MSEHTIGQFCQAIWSIQSQMTVVRDAIVNEKTDFEGDDFTFLDNVEVFMNAYLVAVAGPLDDCIERHELRERMETTPHPFGGEGC